MTLEHIAPASDFVAMIREAVGGHNDTKVFFQVPDVRRILLETAFWDIYYEHCSYFSLGSLARLFQHCDFALLDMGRDYDDQYITLAARPATADNSGPAPVDDRAELSALVKGFASRFATMRAQWERKLAHRRSAGDRVVVWGSGSKGVAFLTTLDGAANIDYVVDINPNRQGYFMPRTSQEIVGPAFLEEYRPDTVIIMNPVYRDEIVADLEQRHLQPRIITL